MNTPNHTPGTPAEKYRDRPTDDGKAGDGAEEPNEGYPSEGLDPDSQHKDDTLSR